MPQRFQRTRSSPMPTGAIYVGRPTVWGNPYRVVKMRGGWNVAVPLKIAYLSDSEYMLTVPVTKRLATIYAIAKYMSIYNDPEMRVEVRKHLRGRDLVCWCSPDEPCHADVLLDIANSND